MPNPLGRRRVDTTPADAKDEIARLKDELNDLRKLYLQDMANVSSDMRALVSQLTTVTEPTPPVVEEPAPADPITE
jgi:hypothetical protein